MANYQITNKNGYFHLKFLAQVDLETVQQAYSALLKSEEFRPESHTLWDFEGVIILLSITDMHKLADAVIASANKRAETAKSAYYTSDPHDAAMLENYITLVAHYPVEFQIFSDFKLAVNWLA